MSRRLEIIATVRTKNQVTIPRSVAERHAIEAGQRLIIIDAGDPDEFTVRVIRSSYAGLLAGLFGTTDENVAAIRGDREAGD